MTANIKRVIKVYNSLGLKWWPTMLATILGFLDSLSNVLLLLGIGEFVAKQLHTTSTKGNLLKIFFGSNLSDNYFNIIFIGILMLKATTISTKYFLNEKIKLIVEKKLTLEILSAKGLKTNRKSLSGINNLIIKGIIGFIADFFFIFLVFAILSTYEVNLAASYLVFVISVVALTSLFLKLNNHRIHEASIKRGKYRNKEKEIDRKIDDLLQTDRLDKEITILQKRFHLFEAFALKKNKIIAISEAISPITFFAFLVIIAYSFSHNNSFTSSNFLEIILLLIYSQGPMRRLLRVPRYWIIGSKAMTQILDLKNSTKTNSQLNAWISFIQKKQDPFSSVISNLSEEQLKSILLNLQNETNLSTKDIRFFDSNSKLVGDTLLSSISFKSTNKEKESIVNLANQLKLPVEFISLLEESKSFTQLSLRFLFFSYILMSEMDQSEIVIFHSDFSNDFNSLKASLDFPLKKTYLCL